ncbi:MAG: UbiA family prenyltransferase [Planctomycetes bacterium]|nr:UbiA family prenyltransferase [Planctomycetota bacterium]
MIRFDVGTSDLAFFLGAYCATRIGGDLIALDSWSISLGWISAIAARMSIGALNDAIDVEKDRQHPSRCYGPVAAGRVTVRAALLWWALLSCIAIACACETNPIFAAVALPAWFIGSAHAASPIKARQVEALRVLAPSLGCPLHLALGWCAIGSIKVPPLLLLLGVWMLGAFLLSTSRLGEACSAHMRGVRVDERSHLAKGISCAIGYGIGGLVSAAIVAAALRVELLLAAPFALALGGYYLSIASRKGTQGIAFSSLRKEPVFLALAVALLAVTLNSSFSNIPTLQEWVGSVSLAR